MQSGARAAMKTAKDLSKAVDALCGNSGTCNTIPGITWDHTPSLTFSADDYAWEFPPVDPPTLGIDTSLPELSGGKTLDEIQAEVHARVWG